MRSITLFLCLPFIAGCAGYSITSDGHGEGYDVYRPEPYIQVVWTEEAKAEASVIWLPDYSTRYRIDTWAFLGKADFEFEFANGWMLTSLKDKSSNTDLLSGLLDLAKSVFAAEGGGPLQDPPVRLYKVVYDEHGRVSGLAKLKHDLAASDHVSTTVPAARAKAPSAGKESE